MDLKDFVKEVISDITNAIKESQENIVNGAIISPMNVNSKEDMIKGESGDIKVSYIDFEVAVAANEEQKDSDTAKAGIKVLSALLGGSVSGEANSTNKVVNESISRIKFSIPVAFPPQFVTKRPEHKVTYSRSGF